MSFWTSVMMLAVLAACKKDECPAVRKDVAVALKLAYEGVVLERDQLAIDADKAAGVSVSYPPRAKALEDSLRLLEQSMDCLVHEQDCCERLSKLTIHERTPIQSLASRAAAGEGLPEQISELMRPLRALTRNLDAIGTGAEDLNVITPWCNKVRGALAELRAAAPAAWRAATEEADKRGAEARAAVATHDALVERLAAAAKAIEKSAPVTMPTETTSSKAFARGRKAVERYQGACH